MGHTKTAKKRTRTNLERRGRNRSRIASIKTFEKMFRAELQKPDLDAARGHLEQITSMYDKAAKVGTVHVNQANRKKSRLTVAYNKAR